MSKKVNLMEDEDIKQGVVYGAGEIEQETIVGGDDEMMYELQLDSSVALKSTEYKYKLDSNLLYNSQHSNTVVSDIISIATTENNSNGKNQFDAPHIDLLKKTKAYEAGELYMDPQYSYFNLEPYNSGSYIDKNDVPAGKDVKVRANLYTLPSDYEEVEYVQIGMTGGSLPLGIFFDAHNQYKFDGYIYLPSASDTYFDNTSPWSTISAANNKKNGIAYTMFLNYDIPVSITGSGAGNTMRIGMGPCFTYATLNGLGPYRLAYFNLNAPANGVSSTPYTSNNEVCAFFENGATRTPWTGKKMRYISDLEYLTMDDDFNTVTKMRYYDASVATATYGKHLCARRSGIQFYDATGSTETSMLKHCAYSASYIPTTQVQFASVKQVADPSTVYDPLEQLGDKKDLYNSLNANSTGSTWISNGARYSGVSYTNRWNPYGDTDTNNAYGKVEAVWGAIATTEVEDRYAWNMYDPTNTDVVIQSRIEAIGRGNTGLTPGKFYPQDNWEITYFGTKTSNQNNPHTPASYAASNYTWYNRVLPRKSRLYSRFRIWKDYELAGYYITCRRKGDGLYGVYNTVNGKFTCSRIDELKSLGLSVDTVTAGMYGDLAEGTIYNGPYANNTEPGGIIYSPSQMQTLYGKTDALSNWEYFNLCIMGPRYTETYSSGVYKVNLKISDASVLSNGLYYAYNHPEKRSDSVINFNVYIDGYDENIMQGMKIRLKYASTAVRNMFNNVSTNIDTRTSIAATTVRDISTAGDLTNFSVSIALSPSTYSNINTASPITFQIDTSGMQTPAEGVTVQVGTSSITIPYVKSEQIRSAWGSLVIQPYDSRTEELFLWPNEYTKINSWYHTLDGNIYEKWLMNNISYSNFGESVNLTPKVDGTAYPWGFISAKSFPDIVFGDVTSFQFENNRDYVNVSDASAYCWPATSAFGSVMTSYLQYLPDDDRWMPAPYCGQTWNIPVGMRRDSQNWFERIWTATIGNPVNQMIVIDENWLNTICYNVGLTSSEEEISHTLWYNNNPYLGILSPYDETNYDLLTLMRANEQINAGFPESTWAHLPIMMEGWNDGNDLTDSTIEFSWNLSTEPYNLDIHDFLNIREHDIGENIYGPNNKYSNLYPIEWGFYGDTLYNSLYNIFTESVGVAIPYPTGEIAPWDDAFKRANFRMFYLQEKVDGDPSLEGKKPMISPKLWQQEHYTIWAHTTDVAPYKWAFIKEAGIMSPDTYLKSLPITLQFDSTINGGDTTTTTNINNAIEIKFYDTYNPKNDTLGELIDGITLKWTSDGKKSTLGNPENFTMFDSVYNYTETNSKNSKTIDAADYETCIALKYAHAIVVTSRVNVVSSVNIAGEKVNTNNGWHGKEIDPKWAMVDAKTYLLYYTDGLDANPLEAKTGLTFTVRHDDLHMVE